MFAKLNFVQFAVSASTKCFGFGQLALLVGSSGLEPPTLRLSGVRSNHLSYEPMSGRTRSGDLSSSPLVEMNRFELSTPCLQGRCSPN